MLIGDVVNRGTLNLQSLPPKYQNELVLQTKVFTKFKKIKNNNLQNAFKKNSKKRNSLNDLLQTFSVDDSVFGSMFLVYFRKLIIY